MGNKYTIPSGSLTNAANNVATTSGTYTYCQPLGERASLLLPIIRAVQRYDFIKGTWNSEQYINEYLNGRMTIEYSKIVTVLNFFRDQYTQYDAYFHAQCGGLIHNTTSYTDAVYDGRYNNIVITDVQGFEEIGFTFTGSVSQGRSRSTIMFEPILHFRNNGVKRAYNSPLYAMTGTGYYSKNFPHASYYDQIVKQSNDLINVKLTASIVQSTCTQYTSSKMKNKMINCYGASGTAQTLPVTTGKTADDGITYCVNSQTMYQDQQFLFNSGSIMDTTGSTGNDINKYHLHKKMFQYGSTDGMHNLLPGEKIVFKFTVEYATSGMNVTHTAQFFVTLIG